MMTVKIQRHSKKLPSSSNLVLRPSLFTKKEPGKTYRVWATRYKVQGFLVQGCAPFRQSFGTSTSRTKMKKVQVLGNTAHVCKMLLASKHRKTWCSRFLISFCTDTTISLRKGICRMWTRFIKRERSQDQAWSQNILIMHLVHAY